MISFIKKYWLSSLVLLIIFVLCFMNTAPLPSPPIHDFDKWVHVLMFLGLSGVIFFDNTRYLRFSISKGRIFWGSFILPSILAGLIEVMQEYLAPTRFGDWFDFYFGVIGAILGIGIALLINRKFLIKKNNKN